MDMALRPVALSLAAALLVGCGGAAGSQAPTETIFIRTFDGTTCPQVRLPPGPITIRINPAARPPDQVWGIDGRGEPHAIFWPEGFSASSAGDPVVLAVSGAVVARDGDVFLDPDVGPSRLNGYTVCYGSTSLYVQLIPPGG